MDGGRRTATRGRDHGARKRRRPPARLLHLRAQTSDDSYSVYTVALRLPPNALGSYFSLAHPDLRIEIINRMVVGRDLMLAEARISTSGPVDLAEWTEELRRFRGVEQVDLQVEGPGRVLSRVVLSRGLVERVVQKHRVLARYPLVIQGGWLRFETLATRSQMRPFLREVEQRVGPSQVESIRRHAVSLGSLGLTASQDAVFRAALRTGYFSVPRRISVSGLAAQLGRSKSSTSEMLSKIHQRLAESALQLDLAPVVAKD